MKTLVALCLLAALGYAGWFYSHRYQPQTDTPQPEQPQVASATPIPAAQTPTPIQTVKTIRHLAPEGTLYLLSYKSVRTAHGFTGLAPGTKVEVVTDKGATMLVRGQNLQFEVVKTELTNDIDLANRVAGDDSAVQSVLAAEAASNENTRIASNLKVLQQTASDIEKADSAKVATPDPRTPSGLKGMAFCVAHGNTREAAINNALSGGGIPYRNVHVTDVESKGSGTWIVYYNH